LVIPQKILIYGENWTGTLPRLIFDELLKRGHSADIFDYTDVLPGAKNRSFFQKVRRRLFSPFYIAKIQNLLLEKVSHFSPDVIIVVKGLHLNSDTLRIIKEKRIKLVNWNPDDFFNLKNSSQALIKSMPIYDVIVSPRAHLFEKYREYGVKTLIYLDWYFIPELHFNHLTEKTIAASFVGSWSPSREKFITELKLTFCIWGSGWEKSSNNFKKKHNVHYKILSQLEMSRVFSSSKYNLNLLTHENSDLSNLRFYEVPASGGLLLTERNDFSVKHLSDREECLMFSSSDEINHIFSQEYDLDHIANNGHKRISVYSNTFSARVDELLAFLQNP
jgi:spore maturation protein CgeB